MAISVAAQPTTEYLFSLHGRPVRFITSSFRMAAPVQELLRHFRQDAIGETMPLTVRFHAVQDQAEIPLSPSPAARHLASGTDVAAEGARRTICPMS
ncbi:MAG: hypothetical protein HC794_09680 [Nitrospiraceae bacterium]|nr:hypothetical protein [Nitrospiraceae bacterium]